MSTIPQARKRIISALAEDIANIYSSGQIVLPEIIATDNEIGFNYGRYGEYFDGLLQQLNGRFHIYINLDKVRFATSTRSRFTFGHELGHYFLEEHRYALLGGRTPGHASVTDFTSRNPVELEADYFACSLLMPETRFRRDCRGQPISAELFKQLAATYQTSITATLLRYVYLGGHPVVVVCSQRGLIKWHWSSPDFAFPYLKSGKVSNKTATGEYYATGKCYSMPEEVFAEHWFMYTRAEPNTIRLQEQCFYYPSMQSVFTVIWAE